MWLPQISRILCQLMDSKGNIGAACLANIILLLNCRLIVEGKVVRCRVLVSVQVLFDLGWYGLHVVIVKGSVVDSGILERTLCQLDGAVAEAFDCYANVVGWMALVFDVKDEILEFGDGVGDLLFRWSECRYRFS